MSSSSFSFWGVELRPGEPYVHRHPPSLGRLCITKAVLVNNNNNNKTAERAMVQCVIGNGAPVIICSLNPGFVEMCHLDLEYEENHEVHFSVLGAASVHLSGYYLRGCNCLIRYPEVAPESHGEDVGAEHESDRETSESHGDGGDVGAEHESDDRETSESHGDGGDAGEEYDSDWEYHHVSEDVSEDSLESDLLDDGDVEIPDNNHLLSESMDDGHMYSTPDRRQEKHQVDSLDVNIDSSPYKPAVSQMFNSGSEDKDSVAQNEEKSMNMHVSLPKNSNVKVSDENVTSNDETKKEINGARKRKNDAINQDLASPMKVTEVNGSSIREPEPEKKSLLEPEYENNSNNTRTLEAGLIIEDLPAGNKEMQRFS
ncbi:peptidyl-prolyl cis-trans isomerase FKBP43-like [Hordeum vulgare subsp. vulgare]|uniref:peptidylprolyl isomerase n=1 Tax=Hordeum vulgare subsp. vulgare TaxID=112509 RepID=A0A8I6XZM6_HORVV|nr:peptidyl-prolyl cis-trans isomerase FKBP43-like [Hordeum vulgare subsp. vulgare]KAI4968269.1 hypothetical protein ZWY2020_060006 [Hordeum vulgare]